MKLDLAEFSADQGKITLRLINNNRFVSKIIAYALNRPGKIIAAAKRA